MIICEIKKDSNIKSLVIKGHAEFDDIGQDIVCAGVSTLVYTIANKILNIDESFNVKIDDNCFNFQNQLNNKEIDLLLETLYEGLLMIQEQYSKNVKIKEV